MHAVLEMRALGLTLHCDTQAETGADIQCATKLPFSTSTARSSSATTRMHTRGCKRSHNTESTSNSIACENASAWAATSSFETARGARRLIKWLRSEDVDIAIATSAEAEEVNGLLKAAGVDDLVERVASSDDAEESKPDPDIVLAALRKSGYSDDRAIMLGDTPYDIQAAAAAGIPMVAFRTGGWSDRSLAGAVAIFDDPEDLGEPSDFAVHLSGRYLLR